MDSVASADTDSPQLSDSYTASAESSAAARIAASASTTVAVGSSDFDPTKVFVSELAWKTTSDALRDQFGTVGTVVNAQVFTTQSGRSQGHGIVQFADAGMAQNAIAQLNGQLLDHRRISVAECYRSVEKDA